MSTNVQISLVIPFYNEQLCAHEVIKALIDQLQITGLRYELILVDNGSHDKTGQILESFRRENVMVLKKIRNEPFGGAILDGFKVEKGEYLGFSWGDGQVSAEDTARICRILTKDEIDCIKGVRMNRSDGISRYLISKLHKIMTKVLLGIQSTDVNGCPLFIKNKFLNLLKLESRDWNINMEIMYKLKLLGINPVEIQVAHKPRIRGKSKLNLIYGIASSICYIISIKLR